MTTQSWYILKKEGTEKRSDRESIVFFSYKICGNLCQDSSSIEWKSRKTVVERLCNSVADMKNPGTIVEVFLV